MQELHIILEPVFVYVTSVKVAIYLLIAEKFGIWQHTSDECYLFASENFVLDAKWQLAPKQFAASVFFKVCYLVKGWLFLASTYPSQYLISRGFGIAASLMS